MSITYVNTSLNHMATVKFSAAAGLLYCNWLVDLNDNRNNRDTVKSVTLVCNERRRGARGRLTKFGGRRGSWPARPAHAPR